MQFIFWGESDWFLHWFAVTACCSQLFSDETCYSFWLEWVRQKLFVVAQSVPICSFPDYIIKSQIEAILSQHPNSIKKTKQTPFKMSYENLNKASFQNHYTCRYWLAISRRWGFLRSQHLPFLWFNRTHFQSSDRQIRMSQGLSLIKDRWKIVNPPSGPVFEVLYWIYFK